MDHMDVDSYRELSRLYELHLSQLVETESHQAMQQLMQQTRGG